MYIIKAVLVTFYLVHAMFNCPTAITVKYKSYMVNSVIHLAIIPKGRAFGAPLCYRLNFR